ncbi:uncharacterized protein LOC122636882 [Vespula pensylvanica]|uniref:uncharacterized protein LOC122636882 n=1 Tax=Vespula pensylvanica TaxID=30213 RepID=UPI001CB9EF61|nr:uncharacterized protein LOC122636882 [Vespula pensylvanica]
MKFNNTENRFNANDNIHTKRIEFKRSKEIKVFIIVCTVVNVSYDFDILNKMNSSGISVKVFQDNKNIYEDYCEYSDVNDLNDVTCNIRSIQRKINDFLTQLLQENTSADKKSHMVVSDTDSNSTDEDVEVEPKKCKLMKYT